ncbi:MAG TPA: FecR family protein [Kofleriaceae bacterium]
MLGLVVAAGCKKGDKAEPAAKGTETPTPTGTEPAKGDPKAPAPAAGDVAADVGVAAGGIEREATEGPAAVATAVSGTVEVRRVGETEYKPVKQYDQLYSGDQVRTSEKGGATIAFADESVAEVAEVTTVGVGSREGTADPGSSAAVLSGLARFTVTPRAPGEGPFRVYTTSGVILTKGTTYGVGVAASGEARVGVESGSVDVVGIADLAAPPVSAAAGTAVVVDATGKVATPAPWPADDWGTWRDDTDAKVEATVVIDAHGAAMADLNAQLKESYATIEANADSIAQFEASAATSAEKADVATYEASLPDATATIDASFSLGGRAEALTWAYAGHAVLAHEIYVRQPAPLEAKWVVIAPRVDAAVLWPKRFEITAVAYLQPLRMQYYVHHPRGRVHAELVGVVVPEFYAKVQPPQIEPIKVRERAKLAIWVAPEMSYRVSARPVWVAAPAVNWRAKARFAAAPPRAKVAWYVRPPSLKAKILVGTNVTGNYASKIVVAAPQPRASIRAAWKVPVGMKIKIGAPDLNAAATARSRVKLDAGGRIGMRVGGGAGGGVNVRDSMGGGVNVKSGLGGGVKVVTPKVDVKVKNHVDAGGGAKVKLKGKLDAAAGGAAGAGGVIKAKIQAPQVKVKVKAPEVKVKAKGEVKGGFKIGN